LRQLEHKALEAVLHAFRAQGPLDVYKEVLLDHLKTSLFISREDYIFKVDHIAMEPTLKKVCDTLNPSYACTEANWLLERQSVLPCDYRLHMNRLGKDVTDIFDPSQVPGDVWKQMYKEHEEQKKQALVKLLTLKKKPFSKFASSSSKPAEILALNKQIQNVVPFDVFVQNRLVQNSDRQIGRKRKNREDLGLCQSRKTRKIFVD